MCLYINPLYAGAAPHDPVFVRQRPLPSACVRPPDSMICLRRSPSQRSTQTRARPRGDLRNFDFNHGPHGTPTGRRRRAIRPYTKQNTPRASFQGSRGLAGVLLCLQRARRRAAARAPLVEIETFVSSLRGAARFAERERKRGAAFAGRCRAKKKKNTPINSPPNRGGARQRLEGGSYNKYAAV